MGRPETPAADATGPHACQGQSNTRGDEDAGGGGVPGKAEAFPALRGREGGPRGAAGRSAEGTGLLPSASTSSTVTWWRPMLNTLPM